MARLFTALRTSACLCVAALAALIQPTAAFAGVATFYGAPKSGGSCTSSFVYPGFKTVAMNIHQYSKGAVCGACIRACMKPPSWYAMQNGRQSAQQTCFNAVVNNCCPGCAYGSLDLGWTNNGRWALTWNYIPCPKVTPQFRCQGCNPYYGKIKVEGMGRINSVTCNGRAWRLSGDGYWVSNGGGPFSCGVTCVVRAEYNRVYTKVLPGSMFGGTCKKKTG